MTGYGLVLVLLNSLQFLLSEALPTAIFFATNAQHDSYLEHCTLYGLER